MKKALAIVFVAAVLAIAHLASFSAYERPSAITRPDQLDRQDCRVGVLAGYDSERVSRKVFPRAQIVGFHEFEDAFMALLAGKIEGFVYNEHVLNIGARAYPNRLKVLDDPISRSPSVVLVSQKRPELLEKVNAFIARYRKCGLYDDMFLRWCQGDTYVPMPNVPAVASATNEVLRIGTSGAEEPSSFVDDAGEVVGFDVEFGRRFAQFIRMKPRFLCRPDDEILDELKNGQLDLVIDDYSATEAEEGMLVSDAYFDADMKVMVKGGDDSGMMLGSTRLGFSGKLIKDPRIRLFVVGFFTTLALTILSALIGFGLARGLREIDVRVPARLQDGIAFILGIIRLLPPPVVILMVGSAILTAADGWWVAVGAFAFWFASFLEPYAKEKPRVWLPPAKTKLVELMQWTSVVGSISVCDLTMAADIVCGRTIAAFGPLLSVAAAYCLMNWIVVKVGEALERKLA